MLRYILYVYHINNIQLAPFYFKSLGSSKNFTETNQISDSRWLPSGENILPVLSKNIIDVFGICGILKTLRNKIFKLYSRVSDDKIMINIPKPPILRVFQGVIEIVVGVPASLTNESEDRNFEISGLWQPFMCRELLWKVNAWEYPQVTGRTPSWSWVSVNCGVFLYAERSIQSYPFEQLSIVSACTYAEAQGYRFIGVSQAALRITCKTVLVERAKSVAVNSRWGCWVTARGWPNAKTLMCNFDFESTSRSSDHFMILPLTLTHRMTWIYGLVIRPSLHCARAFERVGTFEWDFPEKDIEAIRLLTSALQPGCATSTIILYDEEFFGISDSVAR